MLLAFLDFEFIVSNEIIIKTSDIVFSRNMLKIKIICKEISKEIVTVFLRFIVVGIDEKHVLGTCHRDVHDVQNIELRLVLFSFQ